MHIRQSQTWTPLAAINITPLIDVLIVMLVLFIVIAPARTHVLSADVQTPVPFGNLSPPMNRVHVTADDRILWNGTAVSEVELRTIAAHAAGTSPEPELRLSADPQADYAARCALPICCGGVAPRKCGSTTSRLTHSCVLLTKRTPCAPPDD